MDVLESVKQVRDGDFGDLPLAAVSKLNEIAMHLGAVKGEIESRCRKLPPELYGSACIWCGKPEAEHAPPAPMVVGPTQTPGLGRLCPVPGVTSQYFSPQR